MKKSEKQFLTYALFFILALAIAAGLFFTYYSDKDLTPAQLLETVNDKTENSLKQYDQDVK